MSTQNAEVGKARSAELLTQLSLDTSPDQRRAAALHVQIEIALRAMIERDFQEGDAFFKEVDLARQFGVTRTTVRQALSELTRRGLLLRRPFIGSIVTRAAPSRDQAATLQIGVLVTDYSSEAAAMMLQCFSEECHRRGLLIQTHSAAFGKSVAEITRHLSRGPEAERFISFAAAEVNQALQDKGYRLVAIDKPSHTYLGQVVETDTKMAVQIGVDYLRGLGHERILFLVNEPADVDSVLDKMDQFRRLLPGGQMVDCGTRRGESSYNAAYVRMAKVWGAAARPTAIMTASDPGAWAVMRWLTEHGVRVPEEVSVLGFEDVRSSRFMHPSLSSVAHPVEALAQAAVELICSEDAEPCERRLAPNLMIRESTGPVPVLPDSSA